MAERGRGRTKGFVMDDSHRVKIQNSNILNVLIEHALGNREMSQTQVTVGIALMKKVLPDLASVDITANVNGTIQINIGRRDGEF